MNAVFGFIVAWVLVRYDFPGAGSSTRSSTCPSRCPTAVAGIALTALYAKNGWVGQLARAARHQDRLHAEGIFIALVFIGLPFVVRTIQPVLEDMSEVGGGGSDARRTRRQTFFRVVLPVLLPAAPDRLRAGACPRRRRIRLGHLHRRQHPVRIGDRAAPDRHPADRVQLSGGDRDRHDHARHLLRAPAVHQPAPGLEPPEVRQCTDATAPAGPLTLSSARRTEAPGVRGLLIAVAVAFLLFFLLLPLAVVFFEAFREGSAPTSSRASPRRTRSPRSS